MKTAAQTNATLTQLLSKQKIKLRPLSHLIIATIYRLKDFKQTLNHSTILASQLS